MAFVWEQRKLGDITESYSGGTPTAGKKEYYDGNIPFIRSGEISSDKTELFISEEGLNRSSAKMVKIGDILYALYGATSGEVSISKLKGAINQAILAIQPHQNYDSQFVMQWLRKSKENIIGTYLQGGQGNLSGNIVKELIIDIPTYEEQKEIGAYLKKLDHLITLHQRKRMLRRCFFSIDWEQRKLGEVAKYRNGKAHENCIDDDGKYIVVNSKFVSTNGKVKKFSNMQNEPLFENEVAFVLSDVPNGRAIARTFLVEKSDKYTLNQRIAGITPLNETDPYYLHVLMNRHPYFLAFDDGVKQTNLSVSDVMKFESYYPKYEEQETIGRCFSQLDQLITLHQCKSNFCKKNEVNAWEQRKLGDLVERITKKNQDLLSELPLTISAQYGLIDQKEFFDKRVASKDISGYYLIKNGEFAYNKSTSTDAPWGAIKRLDRYETGVLSTLYIVFGIKKDTELNSNFLTAYYSTNLWHKEIHEIAAEGARNHGLLNISPADFFKTKLSTPQDLKEQNKIGNYFIQLDQLITLHQWECNINENTEGNDEKQRKPIKKLIISEGNLSLVDDMFLLHRMTFLVCNKYILLRLNVVKYKITIIIISNILYSIVSLLIIACYLIVINKQLIILIYVEISVVIIKGDDDYARIRS